MAKAKPLPDTDYLNRWGDSFRIERQPREPSEGEWFDLVFIRRGTDEGPSTLLETVTLAHASKVLALLID